MALQDFRAVCMPYCLKKQSDGVFLVLNRDYKPLTFCTYSNDYQNQDLPIHLQIKGLTPKKIGQIISIGEGASFQKETETLFLYHDGSNPVNTFTGKIKEKELEDYFKRLALLMPLAINNL